MLRHITAKVRTERLLRELAALTGVSEAEALLVAVEERVARLTGPATTEERVGRVLAALRAESRRGGEATVPDGPARDRALGYGEEGV